MKKVIVTVGPSVFKKGMLRKIDEPNNIYRINGAHGTIPEIEENILRVREALPGAAILIDLPGNKIRTAHLDKPFTVAIGESFSLRPQNLNFKKFYQYLQVGDVVLADDSTLKFKVVDTSAEQIVFVSESEGHLCNNKGLHVRGVCDQLPFLFEKDKALIPLINQYQIAFIGLSYVRTAEDVRLVKERLDSDVAMIAKVETRKAVEHLDGILREVDHILIDRGDLSTEVGLLSVPYYQKLIIERALFWNKRVFLATQFLRNMVEKPIPTIAEITDLYHTLKYGIYGIQLSEETAIGKYPKECLRVIQDVQRQIQYDFQHSSEKVLVENG